MKTLYSVRALRQPIACVMAIPASDRHHMRFTFVYSFTDIIIIIIIIIIEYINRHTVVTSEALDGHRLMRTPSNPH